MPQFDFSSFSTLSIIIISSFWFGYIFYIRYQLIPFFKLLKFRKKIYNFTYILNFDLEQYPKTIYSKFFFFK
jgi:hypothetical protein